MWNTLATRGSAAPGTSREKPTTDAPKMATAGAFQFAVTIKPAVTAYRWRISLFFGDNPSYRWRISLSSRWSIVSINLLSFSPAKSLFTQEF
jgi:hypothetical protein